MTKEERKELINNFPNNGNVRVKEIAPFLGVGVSTFWKYVREGKINKPVKFGARVSVWDAEYIREISKMGF